MKCTISPLQKSTVANQNKRKRTWGVGGCYSAKSYHPKDF